MLPETRHAERGHNFYPPDSEMSAIPRLYATENVPAGNKIIYLHYFTSSSDWWIAELDPDTGIAFAYVRLNSDDANAEWGYVDLTELEGIYVTPHLERSVDASARVNVPVVVERDVHWKPAHPPPAA